MASEDIVYFSYVKDLVVSLGALVYFSDTQDI